MDSAAAGGRERDADRVTPEPARWSIRLSLSLLVAATLVPALAFSGLLLNRYARSERARNGNAAEMFAARTADAVDRELAGLLASLNALATSPALQSGDIVDFVPQARAVADMRGRTLVLSDAAGHELFRSVGVSRPGLVQLPGSRPFVSGLMEDNGTRYAVVSAPVMRNNQLSYVLSLHLPAPVLADVLLAQRVPPDWTISLVDADDVILSRNIDAARTVGQLATADLRANAIHEQGTWTGTTLTGTTVLAGYARTHLADWRVAVGAPLESVEQPLRRALQVLSGGGLLLLLGSIAVAVWLARQIAMPLHRLAIAGAALSRAETLRPLPTRVQEVASVASALRAASVSLRARTEALDAERARLAAIIETVPVGLLIVNPDMDVMSGNAQAAELLGRPAGPIHLELDLRMADGSSIPSDALPTTRALRGEVHPELECRLYRPDRSSIWVYLIAAPIRNAADAVTGVVVAVLNIDEVVRARDESVRSAERLEQQVTERTAQLESANHRLREEIVIRTETETRLRQAQKMEAVGRLTGGIAHDFNNLLTIVIGSIDLLRRRATDERSRKLAENAIDGAQRAATLTARLLAFSRQQPLAPRTLDVNRLVDGMTELFQRTLGEGVRLETRLDPAAWRVHADPNQLENALLNLAVNAKDAIAESRGPDGAPGRLIVETSNATLQAAADVDVPAGDYLRLAVLDSGTGMPLDVIARAFEPFFTTKPVGQGTGLGLSQVHGFVKQSGGHVEITSTTGPGRGHGTTISIFLPRHDPAEVAAALSGGGDAELPTAPGHGTILLVEDEPAVRLFACEVLRELGYRVLDAGQAAAALDLLDAHPEVRLLFTDMVLQESSGRTLADEARRRRPDLRVLFTTGYTSDRVLREGQPDERVDLITKPYTVQELATKIAAVLA